MKFVAAHFILIILCMIYCIESTAIRKSKGKHNNSSSETHEDRPENGSGENGSGENGSGENGNSTSPTNNGHGPKCAHPHEDANATSPSQCGPNEDYSNEGCAGPSACQHPRCPNDEQDFLCQLVLYQSDSGCVCKKGYVRNPCGYCVPPEDCDGDDGSPAPTTQGGGGSTSPTPTTSGGPGTASTSAPANNSTPNPPQCGENEVYLDEDCVPPPFCQPRCPTDPEIACSIICDGGDCVCQQGYVRNESGDCVTPDQCPNITTTQGTTPPCDDPAVCGQTSSAAPSTDSPPEECTKPNQTYNECGTACEPSCEDPEPEYCTLQCVKGCFCDKGLVKDENGDCIDPDECPDPATVSTSAPTNDSTPSPPDCGENEVYSHEDCVPSRPCQPHCPSCPPIYCTLICKLGGGCVCQDGYVRNDTDQCIPVEECPDVTTTQGTTPPCDDPDVCGETSSAAPSDEPTDEPTSGPDPTDEPTSGPDPTDEPTSGPDPTDEPTSGPDPTDEPTSGPDPTDEPTSGPDPTDEPTSGPDPTDEPTSGPDPTDEPTSGPDPTDEPTSGPDPTDEPTSGPDPTDEPTSGPDPTDEPTSGPDPTDEPTSGPDPTDEPTSGPDPTDEPTSSPDPTDEPTSGPDPTDEPTSGPDPTDEPTSGPDPSDEPTPCTCPPGESTSTPGQSEEPTSTPGQSEGPTSTPGQSEEPTSTPGQSEGPTSTPGQSEGPTSTPGQSEEPTSTPGQSEEPTSTPGQSEEPTSTPGQSEEPTSTPGQPEDPTSSTPCPTGQSTSPPASESTPSPSQCGENELYVNETCVTPPACQYPQCPSNTPMACTTECRLGPDCVCQDGYMRNESGQCVSPDQCPPLTTTEGPSSNQSTSAPATTEGPSGNQSTSTSPSQCPVNEEWVSIQLCGGIGCLPLQCPNNPNVSCLQICVQGGCNCKKGCLRNSIGVCVPSDECDSK